MKVIRNINNNVAVCLDSDGNEIIAIGKGIGWGKTPHDFPLSAVERTFYDIDPSYVNMLKDLSRTSLEIAIQVSDYAKEKLKMEMNSNWIFSLADHIDFTIKRYEKHMMVKIPIAYDIETLYPVEMDIGRYGLNLIRKTKKVHLPEYEAAYIGMHVINAEAEVKEIDVRNDKIITDITGIIEDVFKTRIDKSGFNYSRFVSHMQYLLKRSDEKQLLNNHAGNKLFESMKDNYPMTYSCACEVGSYLQEKLGFVMTSEEMLYVMLHINRLCGREDSDQ